MRDNTELLQTVSIGKEPINENAEAALEALKSEYFGDLSEYKKLAQMRESARESFLDAEPQNAARMAEIAIVASVTSVRTVTGKWEKATRDYLKGDLSPEGFARATRDGEVKAEKITHVLQSDIPLKATKALQAGDVDEAVQVLNGRRTGDTDETYLRTTKSHFVVWLLGFERVCVDHRIHRAVVEIIPEVMLDLPVRRDTKAGEYGRVDAKKRSPVEVEFWHDTLKWSPETYAHLASGLVDHIHARTDIPKDRIPQVAFNVGGGNERTIHANLLRILSA